MAETRYSLGDSLGGAGGGRLKLVLGGLVLGVFVLFGLTVWSAYRHALGPGGAPPVIAAEPGPIKETVAPSREVVDSANVMDLLQSPESTEPAAGTAEDAAPAGPGAGQPGELVANDGSGSPDAADEPAATITDTPVPDDLPAEIADNVADEAEERGAGTAVETASVTGTEAGSEPAPPGTAPEAGTASDEPDAAATEGAGNASLPNEVTPQRRPASAASSEASAASSPGAAGEEETAAAPAPDAAPSTSPSPSTSSDEAAADDTRLANTGAVVGSVRLQLSAVSPGGEDRAWSVFQERYAPLLADKQPYFETVETGGGVLVRIQAGPFASRDAASSTCEQIKAQGGDCFIIGGS